MDSVYDVITIGLVGFTCVVTAWMFLRKGGTFGVRPLVAVLGLLTAAGLLQVVPALAATTAGSPSPAITTTPPTATISTTAPPTAVLPTPAAPPLETNLRPPPTTVTSPPHKDSTPKHPSASTSKAATPTTDAAPKSSAPGEGGR